MIKKNFHGSLRLLLPLLFIVASGIFSSTCNAYVMENGVMQLDSGDTFEILDALDFDSTVNLTTLTDTLNSWLTASTSGDFDSRTCLLFFKHTTYNNNRLYWTINTGGLTNGDDVYLGNSNGLQLTNNTKYGNIPLNYLDNWIIDANNNKIGVNTKNIRYYYVNISSPTSVTSEVGANVPISMWLPSGTDYYTFSVSGDPPVLYIPNMLVVNGVQSFCSYTSTDGRASYYLASNRIVLTDDNPDITPTPSGDSGDSPGGGGTVDLTETNNKIDDVKDEVTAQGEAIISQLETNQQEIIESQEQNTEAITSSIDDAFDPDTSKIDSGDIDLTFENFDIPESGDPSLNFFTWLLNEIQDVLTTDENETLEFDFLDEHYTLQSDFFTISDGPLKTFLVAYFTFSVGLATALDIRKIIENFKNGNVEAIGSDDINANIV